mgnify:FL=1
MTFLPFLLNLARYRINGNGPNNEGRIWTRGVDSYSSLQIGYVSDDSYVEKTKKHEKKTDELQEKLKKI